MRGHERIHQYGMGPIFNNQYGTGPVFSRNRIRAPIQDPLQTAQPVTTAQAQPVIQPFTGVAPSAPPIQAWVDTIQDANPLPQATALTRQELINLDRRQVLSQGQHILDSSVIYDHFNENANQEIKRREKLKNDIYRIARYIISERHSNQPINTGFVNRFVFQYINRHGLPMNRRDRKQLLREYDIYYGNTEASSSGTHHGSGDKPEENPKPSSSGTNEQTSDDNNDQPNVEARFTYQQPVWMGRVDEQPVCGVPVNQNQPHPQDTIYRVPVSSINQQNQDENQDDDDDIEGYFDADGYDGYESPTNFESI